MWNTRRGDKTATVRATATGPCAVCGRESDGSPYWVGIGPAPTRFVTGVNRPLCGALCSAAYGDVDDWQAWLNTGRR